MHQNHVGKMASINYHGRKLSDNKACQIPQSLVFIDCETWPEKDKINENKHHLRLKLGVAKYVRLDNGKPTREKRCIFTTAKDFWNWLESVASKYRTTLVFAHNAIFDFCTVDLTRAIDEFGWKLAAPYAKRGKDNSVVDDDESAFLVALDCPPFILCLQNQNTNSRVILIDTLNYFQCPLEELGKIINLPKLSICFDSCDEQELTEYCERDVDIIKESILSLLQWQSEMDLGNFRYTLPSNSYNAFRHRFKSYDIILHDHKQAKDLERTAYYGGQTEVYNHDKVNEPVYLVDVSSLYPSVMQFNKFPVRLLDYQESENGELTCVEEAAIANVACVELSTPLNAFPVKRGKVTNYEKGQFVTSLSQPELSYAIQSGFIGKVYKKAVYETAPIFTEFVNYFWNSRMKFENEGNIVWANLCKLFLNSLSGKFAQRTNSWEFLKGVLSDEPWKQWISASEKTGIIDHFRAIGNHVQIKAKRDDHVNSFCAISAFVTSYGRERMRRARGIAGIGNYFYQGVDCLVLNQTGLHNLMESSEIQHRTIGMFRILDESCSFHARGKMDYDFGNRRVIAGLKKNAVQISADEFSQTLFSGVDSLFAPGCDKNITTDEIIFHRK